MTTRERDEEIESAIAELNAKVADLTARVEDLELSASEVNAGSLQAFERITARACERSRTSDTKEGERRSVGGVGVPAAAELEHCSEGAPGAPAPTDGGGPSAPGAPGNRGPTDDFPVRLHEKWIGGTYHYYAVTDPEDGPWRTLCGEHEVESMETKTPGAGLVAIVEAMTCRQCQRRVVQRAELALDLGVGDYGRDEAVALTRLRDAASEACFRYRDMGPTSPATIEAIERWRKAWLRWADAFDAAREAR